MIFQWTLMSKPIWCRPIYPMNSQVDFFSTASWPVKTQPLCNFSHQWKSFKVIAQNNLEITYCFGKSPYKYSHKISSGYHSVSTCKTVILESVCGYLFHLQLTFNQCGSISVKQFKTAQIWKHQHQLLTSCHMWLSVPENGWLGLVCLLILVYSISG